MYDTNAANYLRACRYWDHRDIHAGSTTEIRVFRWGGDSPRVEGDDKLPLMERIFKSVARGLLLAGLPLGLSGGNFAVRIRRFWKIKSMIIFAREEILPFLSSPLWNCNADLRTGGKSSGFKLTSEDKLQFLYKFASCLKLIIDLL